MADLAPAKMIRVKFRRTAFLADPDGGPDWYRKYVYATYMDHPPAAKCCYTFGQYPFRELLAAPVEYRVMPNIYHVYLEDFRDAPGPRQTFGQAQAVLDEEFKVHGFEPECRWRPVPTEAELDARDRKRSGLPDPPPSA